MAGRTHNKYTRVYAGGYVLASDARTIGPLDWTYEVAKGAAFSDSVQNIMLGQPTISPGTLNLFLNTGFNKNFEGLSSSTSQVLTVAIGDKAAPTEGDPCFNGHFSQLGYQSVEDGWVAVNVPFGEQISTAANNIYENPWGKVVGTGIKTAINESNGFLDNAAQTTLGGYGILQMVLSNGTCTFKIQDCATVDGIYADLVTFDATGSISPTAEIKALSTTTTVDKYLRWQIELGTATSVTFVMAFVRGR